MPLPPRSARPPAPLLPALALALAACTVVETRGETPAPASARAAASDSLLARRIDSLVRAQAAADSFSGAVLVVRDGREVYRGAVGLADRAAGLPNRTDTKFNLGSVDKYLTRIAVWQLVRDGKLSMDDTLGKFVPDYPVARARSVTVRQLYEMRAGIPDIFNERWGAARNGLRTTDDFIRLFADRPLEFEPGTRQEYCNGCYVLLGRAVEVASGESWYDYARRHIAEPAGMTGTGYEERDLAVPNRAVGYTRGTMGGLDPGVPAGRDGRRPNTFTLGVRGGSVGGGYSTAEDLARLAAAVRGGRLLGRAWTDSLLGPRFLAPEPGRVARSGWNGGSSGVNAVFNIRSDGATIIVLSNYDPPAAQRVGAAIGRLLGDPPG